jgi:hypothetical protein
MITKTPNPTNHNPKSILTYEDVDQDFQEPFALGLYGQQGSGKTYLGARAPGCVGVVPLNRKTRQTVAKVKRELGKTFAMPTYDLIRSSNPMKSNHLIPSCEKFVKVDIEKEQPWCCAKHNGRWAVDRTKRCALDHEANSNVDSVLIDGGDILWEDILIAHYGRAERIQPRDRGPANKEMIEFLGALSDKHLVMTMGAKEVWKNEKPSGEWDWAGFTHLGYHMNAICFMETRADFDPKKAETNPDHWKFSLSVVVCQANAELIGKPGRNLLTDDSITFQMLALSIYPETEAEMWE